MRVMAAVVLLSLSTAVLADDFELSGVVAPADFAAIAQDLSATLNYKALGPVDAGGITGFSVGAFVTYSETENPEAWRRATTQKVEEIGMVGLRATKGLPFGIDVGATYAQVPETDAKLLGAELRYALLEGSAVSPALALRASYSAIDGVDQFDYETVGVDISISKGFVIAAPYAGIGRNRSTMTPRGDFATFNPQLGEVEVEETRLFAGLRLTLFPLLSITPEYEKVGDVTSYNLRVGLSF